MEKPKKEDGITFYGDDDDYGIVGDFIMMFMAKRISRSRETRQPVKLLRQLLFLNENFDLS